MARAKSSGGSSTTLVVVVAAVGILVVGGGVYLLWGGGEEELAQPQVRKALPPPQPAEKPTEPERTVRGKRDGAGEIARPQPTAPQRPSNRTEPKKNEKHYPKRDPGGPPTGLGPV
jgi:hypothetical protein